MTDAVGLYEVRVPCGDGDYDLYEVGKTSDIAHIQLKTDGNGISGYYDRIHVYYYTGVHCVFPAHNCLGWTLIT